MTSPGPRLGPVEAALVRAALTALEREPLPPADPARLGRDIARATVGLRRADLITIARAQALTSARLLQLLERTNPGTTAATLDQMTGAA